MQGNVPINLMKQTRQFHFGLDFFLLNFFIVNGKFCHDFNLSHVTNVACGLRNGTKLNNDNNRK